MEDKSFLYLLKIIWKNKVKLMVIHFIIAVLSAILIFSLPKWYKSNVLVLLEEESQKVNIASAISQIMPFGLGGGGDKSLKILYYIRLLNSRRIMDQVIEEFDLQEGYGCETIDQTYKELKGNTFFSDNEDGTFNISCLYKENPEKAAEMANFYYDRLYELESELTVKQSKDYRVYIEKYYEERLDSLNHVEDRFKKFQDNTGIIKLEDQVTISYEQIAQLELEKMKLEVEKEYLSKRLNMEHADLRKVSDLLNGYKKRIEKLKSTDEYSNVALNTLGEQGLNYMRLYYDYRLQQKIVEFLSIQYEQAKLDESKKEVDICILDKGVPAQIKYKPKRTTYFIIINFFAVTLSLFVLRVRYYYKKEKEKIKKFFQSEL